MIDAIVGTAILVGIVYLCLQGWEHLEEKAQRRRQKESDEFDDLIRSATTEQERRSVIEWWNREHGKRPDMFIAITRVIEAVFGRMR